MANTIKANKHYIYKGTVHVHSTYSDGFGTIATIARAVVVPRSTYPGSPSGSVGQVGSINPAPAPNLT